VIAALSRKSITEKCIDIEHGVELVLQSATNRERLSRNITPRIHCSQLDKWEKMAIDQIGAKDIDGHYVIRNMLVIFKPDQKISLTE
jgi:hypothetical protein